MRSYGKVQVGLTESVRFSIDTYEKVAVNAYERKDTKPLERKAASREDLATSLQTVISDFGGAKLSMYPSHLQLTPNNLNYVTPFGISLYEFIGEISRSTHLVWYKGDKLMMLRITGRSFNQKAAKRGEELFNDTAEWKVYGIWRAILPELSEADRTIMRQEIEEKMPHYLEAFQAVGARFISKVFTRQRVEKRFPVGFALLQAKLAEMQAEADVVNNRLAQARVERMARARRIYLTCEGDESLLDFMLESYGLSFLRDDIRNVKLEIAAAKEKEAAEKSKGEGELTPPHLV